MASGAVKDAAKAIEAAFAGPEVIYPLPDSIQRTVEKLLDHVHDLEDAESQRLHEELLATYKNHVHDEPAKRASFLHALRLLRPAIKGGSKLTEWWDVLIGSVVDGVGFKRLEIEDASEFVLGVLAFDADDDESTWQAAAAASYLQRLLNRYLHHTRLPTGGEDVITSQDEYMASQIEAILVAYGCRRPKELLLALNDLFIQAKYRAQALSLLSAFVRRQPPRLYLVLETPLIDSLKKCLMIDKSGTVVELALTVLIMFLPHITSALFACLPKLFLIYTRVLCWDQVIAPAPDDPRIEGEAVDGDASDEDEYESFDPTWDKLDVTYGNPNDNPETAAPGALYFFTFLYGLFPLNFMNYIRAPRKWLKSINYLEADDLILDKDALRKRTEGFRQVHLLHPHFFTSTPEEELSETRFLKSEPADVVIDCMGLCMAVSSSLEDPGPPPTAKLPEVPRAMVPTDSIPGLSMDDDATLANSASSPSRSNGTWRNTQSTTFTNDSHGTRHYSHLPEKTSCPDSVQGAGKPVDSPTLPAEEESRTAGEPVQRTENARDHPEDAPASPRLESFAETLVSNPTSISPAHDRLAQNIATLQREVMLLRNDLNFERYLKSQHLSHIGHLQQKHIKEATFEAETQNLINTNRILKAKLQKANEINAQLKKEATTTRNQHKKWEGEVKTRITSFQKDSTTLNSSEASLRESLEAAKKDIATMRKIVAETEAKELNARFHLKQKEAEIEEVDILRKEIDDLQRRLREFELKELNFEQVQEESELLRGKLKLATERLRSREYEREALARTYERKFAELETLSQSFSKPMSNDALPADVQHMIDSALAGNNAKFTQLRKTHSRLLHRFTELEIHSQALEAELAYLRGRQNGNGHSHNEPQSPSGNDSTGLLKMRSNSLAGGHSLSSSRGGGSSFATRYGHHHFAESLRSEDELVEDKQSEYNDQASSFSGPSFKTFTGRPERSESLPTRGFHHDPDLISPTTITSENPWGSESHQSKSYSFNQTEPLGQSDGRSTFSGESASASGSGSNKDKSSNPKVNPKSETRVYGRGGAQNIGTNNKKKDDKPKSGGGGFRGFKGLMSHNS
ncbi:Hamartin protein-domain-containing protein [Phyllosticta capitalensis]